jgi:hypothetical protein
LPIFCLCIWLKIGTFLLFVEFYKVEFYKVDFYEVEFYKVDFYEVEFYKVEFYEVDFYEVEFYTYEVEFYVLLSPLFCKSTSERKPESWVRRANELIHFSSKLCPTGPPTITTSETMPRGRKTLKPML